VLARIAAPNSFLAVSTAILSALAVTAAYAEVSFASAAVTASALVFFSSAVAVDF
jgi:hypothetical protein